MYATKKRHAAASACFIAAFFFRARVFFVVGAGEVLVVEVGVDLGGGEVFVAEQFLHAAQVAGGLQDVAGEGVAQHVRVHVHARQAFGGVGFEAQGDAALGQAAAIFVEKERRFAGFFEELATHRLPAGEGFACFAADEDEALDAAFAADDVVFAVGAEVAVVERREFGEAQSGGVEEFEDGVVADEVGVVGRGRFQQGGDLFGGEGVR